jgi:CBS domain-containing protein
LKRLSLRRLSELELEPADGVVAPVAADATTLRDALSLMLSEGSRQLVVAGPDGQPRGVLTLERLTELLA